MARHLVQSKINVELRDSVADPDDDRPPILPPGRMRLYSYYKPSLQAATYGIQAKQTITAIKGDDANSDTITRYNTNDNISPISQKFEVIAPQFSLDPKLINSYYPPSGYSDEGRILPHIVFQDPHVPWYRPAGIETWMTDAIDTNGYEANPQGSADGHNFMPWLALLVFKPAELLVHGQEATAIGLNAEGMKTYDATKLPADGGFQMTVGQYLTNLKSRVCYEIGYQVANTGNDPAKSLDETANDEYQGLKKSTEVMKAIFPTKAQMKTILGGGDDADLAPLEAMRLLAHVRHLNTIGFPDAGVEEEGLFSIVVSSMSGDQNIKTPQTHVVHLVSLEHLNATLTHPKSSFMASSSERIGLVSLYSWTYTCIPESVSFKESMIDLAENAQPLRPPQQILKSLKDSSDDKIKQALFSRLNSGYTVCRWRTATGEESVGFNRGPLVPLPTQDVPTSATQAKAKTDLWPALSMTGKDYQVFDQSTGIMDITYSGAWSAGKLMAISDPIFNAALLRLRSSIWKPASSALRMAMTGMTSTHTQLSRASAAVKNVPMLTNGRTFNGSVTRINIPHNLPIPPAVTDDSVKDSFRQAIDHAMNHAASATTKDSTSPSLYNGFDGAKGNNSDWEIILNWVHDIMYLATVPAHMIFPEPSHLQEFNTWPTSDGQPKTHPEALRFFHIDHAWIDCFLDGALSVANHLEPAFDYTRIRIKQLINKYLRTGIGTTSIRPPVPRYGFVIRSAVVKAVPDLKLTATAWTVTVGPDNNVSIGERDCLVRHTRMDEYTILSLVDCLPEEIKQIQFAQPAHQQRFQIECKLPSIDNPNIKQIIPNMSIKRLYTDPNQAPPNDPLIPTKSLEWMIFSANDFTNFKLGSLVQTDFYNDVSRCIRADKIAQSVNGLLQKWGSSPSYKTKPYDDAVPNSCILGIELNDSAYEMKIDGPYTEASLPSEPLPSSSWTRVIWAGDLVSSAVQPRLTPPTGEDITNVPKPAAQPITRPQSSISVSAPAPNLSLGVATTESANSTSIVIRKPLKFRADPRNPFIDLGNPQFVLVVHPAYKPPPPLRTRRKGDDYSNEIYSKLDYLPTETNTLYDIIFAVRRIGKWPFTNTDKTLKSITIEIPVLAKDKVPTLQGFQEPIEPLLDSMDWSAVGVSMCSNQRFVPTLYSGTASFVNRPIWDKYNVLGITLVPRLGIHPGKDNGFQLLKGDKAAEISVRLSQPRVLPVMNTGNQVKCAQPVTPAGNLSEHKARSLVRMIERYGDEANDEYLASWCTVLKQKGGDKDLGGNDV